MSDVTNIIPSDSPSLFDQLSTLDSAAIVRPNNPPAGIAGFLFDCDLDQFFHFGSEITDHAVEDNTFIQDNIALKPETVVLKGMIAELTDAFAPTAQFTPPPRPLPIFPGLFPTFSIAGSVSIGVGGISASLQANLPIPGNAILTNVTRELAGILPGVNLSQVVGQAVTGMQGGNSLGAAAISAAINKSVGAFLGPGMNANVTQLITQSVNASVSSETPSPAAAAAKTLYQYYANRSTIQPGETNQGFSLGYFYQMWKGRQLFSVETPWGILTNMAILNVDAEQPEDSKDATIATITFKKIRFAKQVTVNVGQLSGRNAFQATAATPAQNGQAGQKPATSNQQQSWLSTFLGG